VIKRRLVILILVLAAFFALQGGEHSTWSWYRLRQEERTERGRIERLEQAIDSLEHVAQAMEHDRKAQERAARERFGMIRDGEYLYRLVP